MRLRLHSKMLAVIGVSALLAACGGDLDESAADGGGAAEVKNSDEADDESGDGKDGWPDVINNGIQPTDDSEGLASSYEPFDAYMSDCLDHPYESIVGTNYTAMIEAMRAGDLHTSFMGPFAYVLAAERAGAEAMAQLVSAPDAASYKSLIIALDSSGFTDLDDLEGSLFAFSDPASTSGYLFPRAMMLGELGLEDGALDSWFGEVIYSGNHTNSALAVLNEDVQAAAIASNNQLFTVGMEDPHPREEDVVVVAETGDIPVSTEAIQKDLPKDLKDAVKSCLLAGDDPETFAEFEGVAELLALRTGGDPGAIIEVDDAAYDIVRETAETLNMSPEQLLD